MLEARPLQQCIVLIEAIRNQYVFQCLAFALVFGVGIAALGFFELQIMVDIQAVQHGIVAEDFFR